MWLKGWKTFAFAIVVGLTSLLSEPGLQQWVAANLPWAGTGLATGIVMLRALTVSPIFKKE